MDLTINELIRKEIGIKEGASETTPMDLGECKRVALIYAKQESLSFANWLSNQVINGRTITKLWNDYQNTLHDPLDDLCEGDVSHLKY